MAQLSMKITRYPGSLLGGNQHGDLLDKNVEDLTGSDREKLTILPARTVRVIVHPFRDTTPQYFGFTTWGVHRKRSYPPFIILNSKLDRRDKLTLLHELIHATGPKIHDGEPGGYDDPTSVFSVNDGRDHIRPEHLRRLNDAWFSSPVIL